MNAETLLQSKLNKVKSFIDNESFVFTFSKTNAFAIHKDQLFKNQLYKTYIDHNGYEVNERKNSPFIKNEKITQILNKNFLFNSSRISINDIGQNIIYEPKENEIEINSKKFKIKEKITKIEETADGKILYNDDNKIKSIDVIDLNKLTIYYENKALVEPFKIYRSTIPFDSLYGSVNGVIYIDGIKYISRNHLELENKTHIIFCSDIEDIQHIEINNVEPLKNNIVEISGKEYNFKFDKALSTIENSHIKFYNNETGIKVISIKKTCSKMSFYYYLPDYANNHIYLYIDGKYYDGRYNTSEYSTTSGVMEVSNLTNVEHEFTWVFYNFKNYNTYINTIVFDDEEETDSSLFNGNYDTDIFVWDYINNEIKKNIINNIMKVESLGFYKISKTYNERKIYLYINYDDNISDNNFHCRCIIDNDIYDLKRGINLFETEATDIYIDIISMNKNVFFSASTDNRAFNKNELTKYNGLEQANITKFSSNEYKNGSNSFTPFYNHSLGIKIVSIKKICRKMSFYYKTREGRADNNYIYLYIDGKYYNGYENNNVWSSETIDTLSNEEHEFTWVLRNNSNNFYSCIDTIIFDDIVETDSSLFSSTYNNELRNEIYKNKNYSFTPFYNLNDVPKIVSIKKTCSKVSFYYKTKYGDSQSYSEIYLYIDGKAKGSYSTSTYNGWRSETIDDLSNEEHEFTWVLVNRYQNFYSCIDTIAFDDIVEMNSSLFSSKTEFLLADIPTNSNYMNGSNSSIPFCTSNFKIVSIKKICSKMSFYYKITRNNMTTNIYLYKDGKYYKSYNGSTSGWNLVTIDNLSNEEHEFTWVFWSRNGYMMCIDTIAFDDIVEMNSSLFSSKTEFLLADIPTNSNYMNGNVSSTPFYNIGLGDIKIVSIKKTCSKVSFYYKTEDLYDYVYFYIDGNYNNRFSNDNNWYLTEINYLSNKEHEFTWVLCKNSCIDTIAFDDIVETDSSLFSGRSELLLADIPTNSNYMNGSNSSTPFYIIGFNIKIVSIKKICSKMSFYYKTYLSYIYLYIDGKYYNGYENNNVWSSETIDTLSNEEHEFTWVLYNRYSYHYSCIDTISFDDIVEMDSSLFSSTYNNELRNEIYKNGDNSSTPFYNISLAIKIVSIKKICSKMSFYYKNNSSSYIYLYIDGKYYNEYDAQDWTLITIDTLSNEEHEFTWVLYNRYSYHYSCIDTISFDDIVEMDSSLFSSTYNNELRNEITYTPFYFYNNTTKIKIISIKKICSKMSFYYKCSSNYIYIYIDGKKYTDFYGGGWWYSTTIDNLSNEEHEFTWVLYNNSYIDTISFDDIIEADSNLFNNNMDYFDCKNENIIVLKSNSKIIDYIYIDSDIYYINNKYILHYGDNILGENIKKILNAQSIYYQGYNDGNVIILFLLDKNDKLKILMDENIDDPYYEGGYCDEFLLLEEEFKNKEIKDIVYNGTNDIYVLTKSGEIYECSLNSYDSESSISERIKYNNIRFVAMKKTEYGIILLGEDGKLYVKGKFVNGEFGLYNTSSITIDEKVYPKAFVSDKLVCISRDEYLEDGEYKLRNIYTLKLYNTDASDGGVYVVKEDGKLYYTGKNTGACGGVFGYPLDTQNIDVWTPVENNVNDIGRISIPRPDYWSYYFDYIMKSDKNGGGNSVENIFFKIDDVWIDWNGYISKYMNVTLRDANNKILKKYKEFKKTDNSTLRKVINFDSFIEYLELNKESIINEFKVDRTLIPQVDYIDKDLNVYTINAGDNISCIKYSQKDIDLLNADLIESLNHNIQLKNEYEAVIENSQDPEEIFEYQNRLAVIELNIENLNEEIANNQNKLGTMNPNNYFDFKNNRIFNPMTVVDTEEKTINYSKSNFSEPNENGEIEIETEEIDGALHVVKSTVSKTVESNITKLKIDLINYDRLNNSSISDAEVLRDDIKMTIMEDPNDERNFEVDDLLVWLNGKFITKDYTIGNDNKAFCNYNGLAGVETRRICEFPGLGEPTQNDNNIPTIAGENATVIEPTVPTELRWDLSTRVFSWEDVKIDGPYKIHDLNNVNSELRRVEFFYFGDVYCSVFTQFLIKNKKCSKNTFILFFNGAVVPEDEYDVSIKGDNTYITLKTFTAYVTSLLQDKVDIMKPGYEGHVRHILSQFDNMSQFSIAFLSSTDKFKKVKMYYDYQTIRDVPKPGQVLFNDIKYNDLILIDGCYVPYLWESRHCIRIPETVNTIRTSENNFIHHSTICRARPYSTYKKESELTDTECRMYAKQNGLLNDVELSTLDISYIRERVKPHIEARNKEI